MWRGHRGRTQHATPAPNKDGVAAALDGLPLTPLVTHWKGPGTLPNRGADRGGASAASLEDAGVLGRKLLCSLTGFKSILPLAYLKRQTSFPLKVSVKLGYSATSFFYLNIYSLKSDI